MNKKRFTGSKKMHVHSTNAVRVPKMIINNLQSKIDEESFMKIKNNIYKNSVPLDESSLDLFRIVNVKKMYFIKMDKLLPLYKYVSNLEEIDTTKVITLNYTKHGMLFCTQMNQEKYKYCMFCGCGDYFTMLFTDC